MAAAPSSVRMAPRDVSVTLPPRERPSSSVSDGTLAGSVLELAQTLTKNNAVLKERMEERARLNQILTQFKKHLAWQAQRKQQLQRNLERLHNETTWLSTKGDEVHQDVLVIAHEARQAIGELDKLKVTRDARKLELSTVEQELKLERDAHAAVGHLCTQANKALLVHTRERDAWKAEADRAQQESRKLKDRLEEMAYRVNGMCARGTFQPSNHTLE
eukprot:CAMPEP_0174699576 /NCGR_PEP_ID=MMETSP1094-20130205/4813_1 /TAXON_ID=156173 /ORGANISM="Chrysochromulina brevifilum, Strain UTEX LB 985" /LENGTH=216 /DNA_ID=CAMNT_0015896937 /DNA_START=26 /DNA_END=676 /DNA_ORIENTATION=+